MTDILYLNGMKDMMFKYRPDQIDVQYQFVEKTFSLSGIVTSRRFVNFANFIYEVGNTSNVINCMEIGKCL